MGAGQFRPVVLSLLAGFHIFLLSLSFHLEHVWS